MVIRRRPRRVVRQGGSAGGGSAEECHRRGLEEAARGDFGAAAASHAAAIRLDPSHAAAHEGRGMALLEIEKYAAARRSIARAMRLGGESPGLCAARGRALSGQGRHAAALRWHRRALKMDPAHMGAHAGAARDLEAMGRPNDALEECERAIASNPSSPAAYVAKADLLARYVRDGGASELYDKAISLDPANAEAHEGRSRMLWRGGGDNDGALASIREAIRLRPDSGRLRGIEAKMLQSLDLDGKAIESFKDAARLGACEPDTLRDMAESLDREGRAEEALAAYGEAVRRSDDGIAHLLRGELYAKLGRHREAIADFDESRRRGMDGVDAPLYKGDSLRALGEARAAARVYKKALGEYPDSEELNEGMAAALGDLGRAKSAAKYRARARSSAKKTALFIKGLKKEFTGEKRDEMAAAMRDMSFSDP